MKTFRFKKIDAFATQKSSGNPAGYIQLNNKTDIDHEGMLKIAKELKGFVNEVGYVYQSNANEFDLKFYSPEREVDFCGHATIAIMYDLIGENNSAVSMNTVKINTNRGTLTVENRIKNEDAVFIMSPLPMHVTEVPPVSEIEIALKLNVSDIDIALPIQIINAGLNTLIVPIQSLGAILSIAPNLVELNEFCTDCGIDIIEVFTSDTSGADSDYRTRVFAPTFGYLEDPATGSGNSAFGYYLRQNNLWKSDGITIEQNDLLYNFNVVKLQLTKDEDGRERVLFGGGAITRFEGKYSLH